MTITHHEVGQQGSTNARRVYLCPTQWELSYVRGELLSLTALRRIQIRTIYYPLNCTLLPAKQEQNL